MEPSSSCERHKDPKRESFSLRQEEAILYDLLRSVFGLFFLVLFFLTPSSCA